MNQLALDLQPTTPEYRTIPLTRGQMAIVDPEDYEYLSKFKWNATWMKNVGGFYAMRSGPTINGKRDTILMSREIMGFPVGRLVESRERRYPGQQTRKPTGCDRSAKITAMRNFERIAPRESRALDFSKILENGVRTSGRTENENTLAFSLQGKKPNWHAGKPLSQCTENSLTTASIRRPHWRCRA